MLWISIALMQDFDLRGVLKALILIGVAIATAALTWSIERTESERGQPTPVLVWIIVVLALLLTVLAVVSPSRLTTVEAVAVAVAPFVASLFGGRRIMVIKRLPSILAFICVALALNRLHSAFGYLNEPDMEDIGKTTIAAVHTVLAGQNPYAAPIDLHPEYPIFPGYKYLPMMIAAYAPLVSGFGETGLRLTNIVLDASLALAVMLVARQMAGTFAGLLALAAYLMLPVLPPDIYKHGVTDLAPVLPLVFALAISQSRPGRAGLLVGLSIASKLFPGLLVALCCLRPRNLVHYIIGGLIGVVPAFVFLIWGPAQFTQNVFMFILTRPMDETSWMYGLPPIIPMMAKLIYFVFLLSVLIYLVKTRTNMVRRCGLIILCVIGAILTGPDAHNNYIIWWIPFFCILLGSQVSYIISEGKVPSGERA